MHRYLIEPFQAGYMRRAWLEVVLLSVMCGTIGTLVVLRRLAFMADALTHTVFPGLAVAFVAGWSLFAGAAGAALVSVLALTPASRHRRIDTEGLLASLLAVFFSVGVIIVSRQRSFASDLTNLLFGRLLLVDSGQLWQTGLTAAVVCTVTAVFAKELVLASFDRTGAEAMGYRLVRLDLLSNALVAATIVAAAQAVGTALVIAMLVTPAATARLLTDRLGALVPVAIGLGIGGGTVGLLVSYAASVHHDVRLAPGATVSVTLTVVFAAVVAGGALARRRDLGRLPTEVAA